MKKIAFLGVLAALSLSGLAHAQTAPALSADKASVWNTGLERLAYVSPQPLQAALPQKGHPLLQRATWYYDGYGVAWSNICQTPNFWVSFGGRYYVVGSACLARYNGVDAWGVMVAR